MLTDPFFPDRIFGWIFCVVLLGLLSVAAYEDMKRLIIPKWLTLPTLALGVVFNLVRVGWVEASGAGVANGLLFALAGFATGFGLFLAMWLLGTCGGGDVKLFAAVGAWIGPLLSVYVLCGTIVLVVVMSLGRMIMIGARKRATGVLGNVGKGNPKSRKRLLAFSLPVALSATVVLAWVFRGELGLAPAPVKRVAAMWGHGNTISHGAHGA